MSEYHSDDLITHSSDITQSTLEISENNYYKSSSENNLNSDEDVLGEEPTRIIHVGSNKTLDGGNGSLENPYSTLDLAYSKVSNEKDLTISISSGVYYLDSELKFNASNLMIQGMGDVVIKCHNTRSLKAFELVSSSSNFTMKNIIFDASDYTLGVKSLTNPSRATAFFPFYGNANDGIFDNCTFRGFKSSSITGWASYNSIFSNCIFDGFTSTSLRVFYDSQSDNKNGLPTFKNCIFSDITASLTGVYYPDSTNCSFIDCWFGQNELPSFLYVGGLDSTGHSLFNVLLPVYSYAVFSVSENYLGSNQYEIVGKLTWNGTDDQEGMENFQPMTVNLVSTTGDINQTATLINGNFRAIYTSSALNHKVTATLDNEKIELDFTTVNITATPVSIYYGEDQNITFNFTQPITANVTVTVSNGSYNKTEKVEVISKDSITYAVLDTLKEGTYDVEINLAENNLFGFNTTTLTVSKVSDYTFDVVAGDVKVGENATISITLPEDVNGTVIVKFGNDTKELSANQTMTVNFTNLNATTYNVNVSYSGNDKYVALDKPSSVTVNKADSSLEIENAEFTYGDVIAIPFNVTNANGVTVCVLNKDEDEVATASSESGIINLDILPAGKYTLEATTIVGPNYEWVSKTIDLTINKANSSIDIQDKEFAYAEEAVINAVTINSTGDVIATLTDENNTEIAVTVSGDDITLPKLNTGKYTLTVTTNPDENHNNVTKTATITINKVAPSMNVIVKPVENITTKDNITLTISLPSDATGEVTVKINGKKTDIKSANETITIDLNNQAGDYIVDVTYSGDKNYESDSTTTEYTVSKAETSITAKQIDFEEGNASKIEVTVPNVESGIVLVDVAGKKFYGDIDNGKATITLEGVSEGNYTANIKFFGDDKYNQATTTADVKVSEDKIITELKEQLEEANAKVDNLTDELSNATDKIADLTAKLNETQANATKLSEDLADAQANVTKLSDDLTDANAKVDNLTGELDNATDKIADLTGELSNATDKIADLTAELNETQANATKLSEDLADAQANVTKLSDDLVEANAKVDDLTAELNETQANATKLSEDLAEANQKVNNLTTQLEKAQSNVTIVVDGVEYPVDVINGTATIKTNSTKPITKKDTLIVANQTFTCAAVDYNAGERGGMFYAILKDNEGNVLANKTVQIAFNGKIYNRTTDDEGKAGLQVNLANANTYTFAVSFQGDDEYNAAFITSSKIVVTKKKTTIKVANKVFKAKTKTKKISVTLKTVKNKYDKKTYLKSGKKVTLKVNGKTYTAKINKKGVAKFTIKITKKGKYTAKIKFAGDKTYKASSKTIKIRIK